jgi:hypothetical protein
MYVTYLGSIALVEGLVIATFYLSYQHRYRARLSQAKRASFASLRPPPPAASPRTIRAEERSRDFWDGSSAFIVMTLAGLLVPLGYIFDQRSYVGAHNEQAFGVATAVLALAIAGMVHVVERALFRRPRASAT